MGRKKRRDKSNVSNQKTIAPNKIISPSISINRPETNSWIECTLIHEYSPIDPKSKIPRLKEGQQGIYKVTYILSVPGKDVFKDELIIEKIMQSGNSHLQVKSGISYLKVSISNDKDSSEILFSCNKSGMISNAQMRIIAPDFVTAQKTAHDLIMPQLSYWSFLFGVTIDISGCEIIEENTESKRYTFGVIGKIKQFSDLSNFTSVQTHRRFFAAYREGMNATNVFYQALTFYKIIEGVIAERTREKRRTKGEIVKYENETFPQTFEDLVTNDELSINLFQTYLGKTFEIAKDELKDLIRNAIAHLTNLDTTLDPDKFDDINTCLKAVPVLRYIAHKMLENELLNHSSE